MTSDIEAQRARNRAEFPGMAKIMDAARAIFGDGLKMVYGVEGGRAIGKRIEDYPEARRIERATAFRMQARRAYFTERRRTPLRGEDAEWSAFLAEYTAQHWGAFPGGGT